ncbi:hypothetical protein SAMN04487776_1133 [Priestia megaterium]|nr:hypothetical protein SAMN04487776_1133 [Priestia megaterium]
MKFDVSELVEAKRQIDSTLHKLKQTVKTFEAKENSNRYKSQIWQGCMLSSIAHAISVAQYPEFANEQSWDGDNYSMQDSQGGRGTITFNQHYCVAAFRDDNSSRIDKHKNANI